MADIRTSNSSGAERSLFFLFSKGNLALIENGQIVRSSKIEETSLKTYEAAQELLVQIAAEKQNDIMHSDFIIMTSNNGEESDLEKMTRYIKDKITELGKPQAQGSLSGWTCTIL